MTNFVHADVRIKKDKNKIFFLIRIWTRLFRWEMDQELEISVRGCGVMDWGWGVSENLCLFV